MVNQRSQTEQCPLRHAEPAQPVDRRIIDLTTREPIALVRDAKHPIRARTSCPPFDTGHDECNLGVTVALFIAGCLLAIALFVWLVSLVSTHIAAILLGIYGTTILFILLQLAVGLRVRERYE